MDAAYRDSAEGEGLSAEVRTAYHRSMWLLCARRLYLLNHAYHGHTCYGRSCSSATYYHLRQVVRAQLYLPRPYLLRQELQQRDLGFFFFLLMRTLGRYPEPEPEPEPEPLPQPEP